MRRGPRGVLLDPHFLVWILQDSARLRAYGWLDRYVPWAVSPVSLLEIALLIEAGRLRGRAPQLTESIVADRRFLVDEVPLLQLAREAMPLGWTRDPFDRLLAAHSAARRLPLCTLDATLRRHHGLVVRELADV